MSKYYLISLAMNTLLLNRVIYESDVVGLMEYLESVDVEQILEDYLEDYTNLI